MHPTDNQIELVGIDFDADQKKKVAHEDTKYSISPRIVLLHKAAFKVQVQQTMRMKEKASKLDGVIKVGDVVHIPFDVVDQTKFDGKIITRVVVEILRHGQVWCACNAGVLGRPYAKHHITVLQGISNI